MVAKLKPGNTDNLVTIVGFMEGVSPGEALKIMGDWETHPKYGEQFRIKSYDVTLPSSVEGIKDYLKSGIIKGICPMMAGRMVKRFGADTLNVIENYPEKLLEVEGIGKTKTASIDFQIINFTRIEGGRRISYTSTTDNAVKLFI